jgi:hypothetical protein
LKKAVKIPASLKEKAKRKKPQKMKTPVRRIATLMRMMKMKMKRWMMLMKMLMLKTRRRMM